MALNKVILVGRLTQDPELKQTDSGIEVTRFGVAINTAQNKTDFFDVVAWRQTATFISRYFKKGDGICVDGYLSSRSYEKNGVKHTVYEVVCDKAGFAEGRSAEVKESRVATFADIPKESTARVATFDDIPVDPHLPF